MAKGQKTYQIQKGFEKYWEKLENPEQYNLENIFTEKTISKRINQAVKLVSKIPELEKKIFDLELEIGKLKTNAERIKKLYKHKLEIESNLNNLLK